MITKTGSKRPQVWARFIAEDSAARRLGHLPDPPPLAEIMATAAVFDTLELVRKIELLHNGQGLDLPHGEYVWRHGGFTLHEGDPRRLISTHRTAAGVVLAIGDRDARD